MKIIKKRKNSAYSNLNSKCFAEANILLIARPFSFSANGNVMVSWEKENNEPALVRAGN
jgi:hypothetical protein